MPGRNNWTRQQLLVAFALYCRLPFGRLHARNPEIVRFAAAIGRTPSALAMKLSNIASLDPAITSTGRAGLKAVSSSDRAMWEEMQSDWAGFAVESQQAMDHFEGIGKAFGRATQDEKSIQHYYGGERPVQTTARIGQQFFRRTLLSAYDEKCCISGLSVSALLVASHIVPWRIDDRNRVNPRNGLLLSVLHDKAFDAGLITVNDDMTVRVSQRTARHNDFFEVSIGRFHGRQIHLPEKFSPDKEFLAYHRMHIFEKSESTLRSSDGENPGG